MESRTKELMWYIEYLPPALYRQLKNKDKELYTGPSKESKEEYNKFLTNVLNSTMQLKDQVKTTTMSDDGKVIAQLHDNSIVEWDSLLEVSIFIQKTSA